MYAHDQCAVHWTCYMEHKKTLLVGAQDAAQGEPGGGVSEQHAAAPATTASAAAPPSDASPAAAAAGTSVAAAGGKGSAGMLFGRCWRGRSDSECTHEMMCGERGTHERMYSKRKLHSTKRSEKTA